MRRLYLSIAWDVFQEWQSFLKIIRGGTLVRLLRLSAESYVEIAQVWLQPNVQIETLSGIAGIERIMSLSPATINPVTVLIEGRNDPLVTKLLQDFRCSIDAPTTFDEQYLYASLLGDDADIAAVLEFLRTKVPNDKWKLLSLSTYTEQAATVLQQLTAKQREAVIEAYKSGYYEIPRKINITELAERAGVSTSTFDEHLRKAEQKLMQHILDSLSYSL
ncbi:MAG: helix-turn-helix domain-containing protein [Candidatus Hodarchaeota archaeon]